MRCVFRVCKRIPEHAVTERAGCANSIRTCRDQFLHASFVHAISGLFAQKNKPTTSPATERALPRARRVNHSGTSCYHLARFLIDTAVTAEIARLVEDNATGGVR